MNPRLAQWLLSDDTGASSKAIAAFLMGTRQGYFAHPYDPSDFGRCYRLLELDPLFRLLFTSMGQVSPTWKALIENWVELERLWREESPSGRCPKLYDRMLAIRLSVESEKTE